MMREEIVFGPVRSRRLGTSLGVNLLPTKGKVCNFDCIYCECGWNAEGRTPEKLPTAAMVRGALEDRLRQNLLEGTRLDSITFSGDGEPTLNPEFPAIIDDTLRLRDAFCPETAVSVLSNATGLKEPGVLDALRRVDNPIMKIDAPTNELAALINRPAPGYDVNAVVEDLASFDGNFVLQTMFLRTPSFDSTSPEVLQGWMRIVRLLRPRRIMVYTVDRPTPMKGIEKISAERMRTAVQALIGEGFDIGVFG